MTTLSQGDLETIAGVVEALNELTSGTGISLLSGATLMWTSDERKNDSIIAPLFYNPETGYTLDFSS